VPAANVVMSGVPGETAVQDQSEPVPPARHAARHRTATRLPGPIGLASLVAVLLPPSFASGADPDSGDKGGRTTAVQATTDRAPADSPATGKQRLGGSAPVPSPTVTVPAKPRAGGQQKPPARPRSGTVGREDEVTALVNDQRVANGCQRRLRTDERLRRAARGHSQDMADRNYFSHDSQDGRSPWDRAKAQGYAQPIGENIAKGQRTPADVVEAWMNSPGHRANILNCDAKAIGVGLAYDGDTPIWTQLFGAI
jgi:uncharacterized protein YkwD